MMCCGPVAPSWLHKKNMHRKVFCLLAQGHSVKMWYAPLLAGPKTCATDTLRPPTTTWQQIDRGALSAQWADKASGSLARRTRQRWQR